MNPNNQFLYGFYLFLLSLDNWFTLMRQEKLTLILLVRCRTFRYMDRSLLWDD